MINKISVVQLSLGLLLLSSAVVEAGPRLRECNAFKTSTSQGCEAIWCASTPDAVGDVTYSTLFTKPQGARTLVCGHELTMIEGRHIRDNGSRLVDVPKGHKIIKMANGFIPESDLSTDLVEAECTKLINVCNSRAIRTIPEETEYLRRRR